jgi:hypothetical protein
MAALSCGEVREIVGQRADYLRRIGVLAVNNKEAVRLICQVHIPVVDFEIIRRARRGHR